MDFLAARVRGGSRSCRSSMCGRALRHHGSAMCVSTTRTAWISARGPCRGAFRCCAAERYAMFRDVHLVDHALNFLAGRVEAVVVTRPWWLSEAWMLKERSQRVNREWASLSKVAMGKDWGARGGCSRMALRALPAQGSPAPRLARIGTCPSTAGSAFAFSFSNILAVLAGSANLVFDLRGRWKKNCTNSHKKRKGGGSANAPHCARSASDLEPGLLRREERKRRRFHCRTREEGLVGRRSITF